MSGLRSALLGLAVLVGLSAPAFAGLEFTDTLTASSLPGGGSTPGVRFNGSQTINTVIPNGYRPPGPDLVTVSSVSAVGTIETARLTFAYTGLNNGVVAARYDTTVGSPPYNMVIQLGTISTSTLLQNIEFHEFGNPANVFSVYTINQALTAADSNSRLHVFIPPGIVAPADRDLVDQVVLQFSFAAGNTFGVNAVANPEPGTIALFGLGLLGLGGGVLRARRKRLATQPAAN